MEMKLVAGTIRQPRARRGMVGRVLAKGLAKLGPIGEQDLERYHLGMVKDEAELAALEEHLLWCSAWVDRAGLLRGTWMPWEPQPANKPLARASGFTDGGLTSPTHGKEARQQKQRVWGDSSSVLPFWGGVWRPVAFVAVRPPVLFPCAGGQRGCRGVAHPKILGCTPPGHGDGAGGRNRPRNFSTPRREGPRSAAGWSSPWKRSFCAWRQDGNKTVSCRGHRSDER